MNALDVLNHLLDRAVVVDFESYFDPKCSLSSLSYTDYVEHPEFFVRGMSIADGRTAARWVPSEQVRDSFPEVAVMHNCLFDLTLSSLVYQIAPNFAIDTKWLAALAYGQTLPSLSLDSLLRAKGLGAKSEGLKETYGVRELTPEVQAKLEAYAINDAERTLEFLRYVVEDLLKIYPPEFVLRELQLMNLTARMLTRPKLRIDIHKLAREVDGGEKAQRITRCAQALGLPELEIPKLVRSRKRFAAALSRFGVEAPVKISPATGEETYAFGKNDEGMRRLMAQGSEGPLADLVALKLALSSTINDTRAARLVRLQEGMQARGGAFAPVPVHINYYGALQTGRWSGANKLNLQNLPRNSVIRDSIEPPPGYKLLIADFEQIEARVLAWLCHHHELTSVFSRGEDVYVRQAQRIWTNGEIDKIRRFVGKVCILGLGYGAGWSVLEGILRLGTMGPAYVFDEEAAKILGVYEPMYTLPFISDWPQEKRDLLNENPSLLWHFAAAKELVDRYRQDNKPIRNFWYAADPRSLLVIGEGVLYDRLPFKTVNLPDGIVDLDIRLPSGRLMTYHDIRVEGDKGEETITYTLGKERVYTYSCKIVENITQATARDVLAESWVRVAQADRHAGGHGWLIPVLSVHDELVFAVPDEHAEYLSGIISKLMARRGSWMDGLPLGVKTSIANHYGEK